VRPSPPPTRPDAGSLLRVHFGQSGPPHELMDALGNAAEASLGAGDLRVRGGGPGSSRITRCWPRSVTGPPAGCWWPTRWPATSTTSCGAVLRFAEAWHAGRSSRPVGAVARGGRDSDDPRPPRRRRRPRRSGTTSSSSSAARPSEPTGTAAVFDAVRMLHYGQPGEALERLGTRAARGVEVGLLDLAALVRGAAGGGGRPRRPLPTPPPAWPRPGPWWPATRSRPPWWSGPARCTKVTRSGCSPRRQRSMPPAAGTRSARTLVLAGGDHARRGQAALAELGLAPMTP
jgi:hypothetical protein